MITIYNFRDGVRGIRVAWQCEEMGLPYKPVGFEFPVPPEFRAKHPLDFRRFSGERLGSYAARLSNCIGLRKPSAEWRRTGL